MDNELVSEHLTVRVSPRLVQDIATMAKRRGMTPTSLARAYLDEGVRMERFPGIVFIDRAGGRRATLAGRRIDVWQVLETYRAEEGDVAATADDLLLRADQVRIAIAYAADFPDEIEALIQANREEGERLLRAEARQQALLGR